MLTRVLKCVLAALLLGLALYWAGLTQPEGWQGFVSVLRTARPGWLVLALLYIPLIDFVSTVKWFYLCRDSGFEHGLFELFAYYVAGRFFNLVLPSNVGGDFVRVHLIARDSSRYVEAGAVVSVERITGLLVLTGLAVAAVAWLSLTRDLAWIPLVVGVGSLALASLWFLIQRGDAVRWLRAHTEGRHGALARGARQGISLLEAMQRLSERPRTMRIAFLNSLVFYAFAVGNLWVSISVFDPTARLSDLIIAVPIIMFLMNLPISIGGIGITEFAHVFVLGVVGIDPAIALSTTVLMRFKTLLGAGLGWLVYTSHGSARRVFSTEELVASVEARHE